MEGNIGQINGQPPLTPRTPAPSTDSREEEEEEAASENSENTIKSGVPRNTTEEDRLAEPAESIHIHPPTMATMTEAIIGQEQVEEVINKHTGHHVRCVANIVDDEVAMRCAIGPDMADPPSGGPKVLPELPPIQLPQDDQLGRGFPGEGLPGGGGFPGGRGGFPGRGGYPRGGGWGPPPIHAPQANPGKLVGELPNIFDGDQKQTQLFINQWELYWWVNNDNTLMMNPYRQAMFFLTYIKGAHVDEWVVAINQWLAHQLQGGINALDERLWNEVATSFIQQFADSLAKENVQSVLRKGIKMKEEDNNKTYAKVECYTCHKKGHLSCNCPQHTWDQHPSQGQDAVVDD